MPSPSSAKVDDFLLLLSLLSQQRLLENTQRQRQLQRNIDELRRQSPTRQHPPPKPQRPHKPVELSATVLPHAIPLLKFNRTLSSSVGGAGESPPPFPARPVSSSAPLNPTLNPTLSSILNPILQPMPAKPGPFLGKFADDDDDGPPLPARRTDPSSGPYSSYIGSSSAGSSRGFSSAPVSSFSATFSTSSATSGASGAISSPSVSSANSAVSGGIRSFLLMEAGTKGSGNNTVAESKLSAQISDLLAAKTPAGPNLGTKSTAQFPYSSSHLSRTQANTIVKPLHLAGIAAAGSARTLVQTSRNTQLSLLQQQYIPSDNSVSDVKAMQLQHLALKKLSPKRDNTMSWLESAVRKSPEQPARHFVISKKHEVPAKPQSKPSQPVPNEAEAGKPPVPAKLKSVGAQIEVEKPIPGPKPPKPANAALEALEKLRKSPVKQLHTSQPAQKVEFLKKFGELKKPENSPFYSSTPLKPSENPMASLKSRYEESDARELKDQLSKTIGNKPKPVVPEKKLNYIEKDTEELRNHKLRLSSSRKVDSHPDTQPEGLKALGLLKPAKPPAKVVAPKPEALRKLDALKKPKIGAGVELECIPQNDIEEKPKPAIKPKPKSPEKAAEKAFEKAGLLKPAQVEQAARATEVSFQDRLSSILRSNSAPVGGEIGPKVSIAVRSLTTTDKRANTAGSKLVHANKSRAKGPKRKLPTGMNRSKSGANKIAATSAAREPQATQNGSHSPSPQLANDTSELADPVTVKDATPGIRKIADFKRVPPPVNRGAKKAALENLKPRNFSGEIFL